MKILQSSVKLIVIFVGEYIYYIAMIKRLYFLRTNESEQFKCAIHPNNCHRLELYLDIQNIPKDLNFKEFKTKVK